jgi:putative membrane protein
MGTVAELRIATLVTVGLAAFQQPWFLAVEERGESVRLAWIGIFMAVLIWSGIGPKDYMTWCLEVAPAVIGGLVLWFTRDRFPLTTLVYVLILIHCIILMVGGHYTYAEVPLGEWAREVFDGSRNNYDKLGHFVQGFIPAMIARELVIRLGIFNSERWRNFFIVCFCLAFSAFYELIEWWVALLSDEAADAFLGTQGYVWDTQSDMGWALFGTVAALVLLGRLHDRQLRERGFVSAV